MKRFHKTMTPQRVKIKIYENVLTTPWGQRCTAHNSHPRHLHSQCKIFEMWVILSILNATKKWNMFHA